MYTLGIWCQCSCVHFLIFLAIWVYTRGMDEREPHRPEFFTVAQLAVRWQVNPRTVRRWIDEGKLAAVRVGDLVRVPAEAVLAFESSPRS